MERGRRHECGPCPVWSRLSPLGHIAIQTFFQVTTPATVESPTLKERAVALHWPTFDRIDDEAFFLRLYGRVEGTYKRLWHEQAKERAEDERSALEAERAANAARRKNEGGGGRRGRRGAPAPAVPSTRKPTAAERARFARRRLKRGG